MIDAKKTNERSVLTPDGIGTLKEIAYRDDEPKTVKVLFVDPKGRGRIRQYKVSEIEEVGNGS